jgi:hypothetical protein
MRQVERLLQEHRYPPSLIYNFDETMVYPGKRNTKVIVRSHGPRPIEKNTQQRRAYHVWPVYRCRRQLDEAIMHSTSENHAKPSPVHAKLLCDYRTSLWLD